MGTPLARFCQVLLQIAAGSHINDIIKASSPVIPPLLSPVQGNKQQSCKDIRDLYLLWFASIAFIVLLLVLLIGVR